MESSNIEVGDHVTIGKHGSIHWVVMRISKSGIAYLESGMTDRRNAVDINSLKLYRKG